jgi:hypothetical protein
MLVVSFFWWNSAQELPVITVPTPKFPNPNAFDAFNAAAGQLLDGGKIGYALSPGHSGAKDDREYTWAEKQKFIDENGPALALFRQGLDEEYVNPPSRSFSTLFPYYAQFRSLARTLALDSQVKAHRGDYGAATQSSMDAMEMGAQIPHGSVLIGGLVGIACQSIGRRQIWGYLDHMNLPQTRAAAKRLERIRAKAVPYATVLQEDKWAVQSALLEVLRKPDAVGEIARTIGSPAPAMANSPVASQFVFLVYSKRRIMNSYTKTSTQRSLARNCHTAQRRQRHFPTIPSPRCLCRSTIRRRFHRLRTMLRTASWESRWPCAPIASSMGSFRPH